MKEGKIKYYIIFVLLRKDERYEDVHGIGIVIVDLINIILFIKYLQDNLCT